MSAEVGVQQNVLVGCCALVELNVPAGMPPSQVTVRFCPASGSLEKISKQVCSLAQTVIEKLFVPLIPVSEGKLFAQFMTVICMSRSTVPMRTPFLYSLTNTAITVTSRL